MSPYFVVICVVLIGCSESTAGEGDIATDAATQPDDTSSDTHDEPHEDIAPDIDGDVANETNDVDDADVVDPCDAPPSDSRTRAFDHPLGRVAVEFDAHACLRTYRLSSTATRRDDLPTNPRVIVERDDAPRLRTGHDLFDATYALALDEVRENSVAHIVDSSFNGGQPLPCPAGGCFETGRKWPWVWTRDTAYAVHLGLAALDPIRSKNSLIFKTSERRGGGDRQVVQDTGSGGAWPVSSDRVVWALGARAVLNELDGDERASFRDLAIETLRNTIELDRQVVFDTESGLYFGEQSFLDWREQSYPLWTRNDVIDIATSRSLSTNVLHLEALRLLADLLEERGEDASRYRTFAQALQTAIGQLWREDLGAWGSYLPTPLDAIPVARLDLLGTSLAILANVSPDRAGAALATHPAYGPGMPVIAPQQQLIPIYHNRASWPFVTAYALIAARQIDGAVAMDGTAQHLVDALWQMAALNLSNMENLDGETGAPWRDDPGASGPVVNSQRQLWSVAGHLAMVHRVIFGLRPQTDGLAIEPWLTGGLRDGLFAHTDRLMLTNYPYRGRKVTVHIHLPPVGSGDRYRVGPMRLDGVAHTGPLPFARLAGQSLVEIELIAERAATRPITWANPAQWREVFSPRTPNVQRIEVEDGKLRLVLWSNEDDRAGLSFDVWRDGRRVAQGLPGTTESWVDSDSDADADSTPCYVVEARFSTGTVSQRSRANCWWGRDGERIRTFPATDFVATGGELVQEYEHWHHRGWGDPGHRLEIRDIEVTVAGRHLLQVTYGNGAGPINTGIACGTKRVTVTRRSDGVVVGDGVLVMPQLGRWDRWALSSVVSVTLEAGRYDVAIFADPIATNMSDREAFSTYRGAGALGGDAPFNRVNIAELRLLRR